MHKKIREEHSSEIYIFVSPHPFHLPRFRPFFISCALINNAPCRSSSDVYTCMEWTPYYSWFRDDVSLRNLLPNIEHKTEARANELLSVAGTGWTSVTGPTLAEVPANLVSVLTSGWGDSKGTRNSWVGVVSLGAKTLPQSGLLIPVTVNRKMSVLTGAAQWANLHAYDVNLDCHDIIQFKYCSRNRMYCLPYINIEKDEIYSFSIN